MLKAYNYKDDLQVRITTAEVMTVVLVAAFYFKGNIELGRYFLHEHNYIKNMLSKSRLNRRIHAIDISLWHTLFSILAEAFKATQTENEFIVDSCPVPVCQNIRIKRCKLFRGKQYHGWIASKRTYFYGLRIHLLVSASGDPIEFIIAPGAVNDLPVFKNFDLDLPDKSIIYADKLFNDYAFEDFLQEWSGISFRPLRKKNSKRAYDPWSQFLYQSKRKRVETSFSQITNFFPKTIHAVTPHGFLIKLFCFIIAFAISCLYN